MSSPIDSVPRLVQDKLGNWHTVLPTVMDAPSEREGEYCPGGYSPVKVGDVFDNGRYEVEYKLGYGGHSTVWSARDKQLSKSVALKMKKARDSEKDNEAKILSYLKTRAAADIDSEHVTFLMDSFYHESVNGRHHCLVFEKLGESAYHMLQEYSAEVTGCLDTLTKFPYFVAKKVLKQVLLGLDFLHKQGVVHGDLYMANMLFNVEAEDDVKDWAAGRRTEFNVKISDFGSSFMVSNTHDDPELKTPLSLRPPELVLQITPYDTSLDMWSFGCLLYEMLTGWHVFYVSHFPSHESFEDCNDEHLLQMHEILGSLPEKIHLQWPRSGKYFTGDQPRQAYNSMISGPPQLLEDGWPSLETTFHEYRKEDGSIGDEDAEVILSMIRDILQYSPPKSPSAADLLRYMWWDDVED